MTERYSADAGGQGWTTPGWATQMQDKINDSGPSTWQPIGEPGAGSPMLTTQIPLQPPASKPASSPATSPKISRWVELAARSFLADNEDAADDVHELQTRAAHYAQLKTSALSPGVSRAIVASFVDRIGELGRKLPRRTAAAQPTVLQDFPSELIYIP